MRTFVAVAAFLLLSCQATSAAEISSPTGTGAAEPYLAAGPHGALLMSWLEPSGSGRTALRLARYDGAKWSTPATITESDKLFVNWADFPSVVADAEGTLFAHWLQKSGSGTYSYDVYVTSSRDGKTWRKPRVLHTDGKQSEHGFVSFVPLAKRGVGVVWLDGRNLAGHDHGGGEMMVRYAELDAALKVSNETMLDGRTCECCATALTRSGSSLVAAWRDRSGDEIRDVAVSRRTNGRWSTPVVPHRDNWKINGCPVNGPQLDARGDRVALAWFSGAPEPRVQVAFSNDAGATWSKPVLLDSGTAIGRVDVLFTSDRDVLVTWLDEEKPKAKVMARRVSVDGKAAAPFAIAETSSARSSGFPRIAAVGKNVYAAWTDTAAKRVRVARVD
jgi:hypothetical protein